VVPQPQPPPGATGRYASPQHRRTADDVYLPAVFRLYAGEFMARFAVLMIFARLRHCAMNVLIRSIGTILTPFSVRKQPHRRMCSGLMPMPMKRPVR
jgi:hypothetical protein